MPVGAGPDIEGMTSIPGPGSSGHVQRLRSRYEAALAAASGLMRRAADVDALTSAAAEYAAVPEGGERVASDLDIAERSRDWERAAALRSGADRGRAAREADAQARALLRAATAPAPVLGARPVKAWHPKEPVWMKSADVDAALASLPLAGSGPAALDAGRRALRWLFARAWEASFYPDGPGGACVGPYSDGEGWAWRRQAAGTAVRQMAGAVVVAPAAVKVGMAVFTGYAVREVAQVTRRGSSARVRADGRTVTVPVFDLTFVDGQHDRDVAGDYVLVRLPALESGTVRGVEPLSFR